MDICCSKDHIRGLNAVALQLAIDAMSLYKSGVTAFWLEQAACQKVTAKHSCNTPNLLFFVLSCAALTQLLVIFVS